MCFKLQMLFAPMPQVHVHLKDYRPIKNIHEMKMSPYKELFEHDVHMSIFIQSTLLYKVDIYT